MFKFKKKGRIFKVDNNYPWMNSHTTPIASILIDDRIRVYFSCRAKIDDNGNFISNSGFVDLDKDNPKNILYIHDKPLLKLGVYGSFDEFGIMVTDVICNEDKIYMYYAGWQRLGGGTAAYQVMLGLAISEDKGLTFKKVSKGPIMGIDFYDPISIGNVSVIKEKNKWSIYYTNLTEWKLTGEKPSYEYEIKHASSTDGIFWQKSNRVMIGIKNGFGVATPTVHKINDKYHMWFGFRKLYDKEGKVGSYLIGYASSINGVKWFRDDELSGIEKSEEGWDSEMICYPDLVQTENKLYLFYCGNGFGKDGFGYAECDLS